MCAHAQSLTRPEVSSIEIPDTIKADHMFFIAKYLAFNGCTVMLQDFNAGY